MTSSEVVDYMLAKSSSGRIVIKLDGEASRIRIDQACRQNSDKDVDWWTLKALYFYR